MNLKVSSLPSRAIRVIRGYDLQIGVSPAVPHIFELMLRPCFPILRASRFRSSRPSNWIFDAQVAERNLGFAVAVNLKGDQAAPRNRRLGFGVIHGGLAVERDLDAGSGATHLVAIPVTRFFRAA